MATNKVASKPAWVQYFNNKDNTELQNAFRADFKANAKKLGYPNKDEISVVDNAVLDMSHTAGVIGGAISGYMASTHRAFDLPAPNAKTAPATLKVAAIPEKTKTGTIMLGDKKGQSYTSTVKAHEEVKVKSHNKDFKK